MQHAGFVRYFESALQHLNARGHRVIVVFQTDRDKLDEQAAAHESLRRAGSVEVEYVQEARHGVRDDFVAAARSIRDALRYQGPAYRQAPLLRIRAERFLPGLVRGLVRACGSTRLLATLVDRLCRLVERTTSAPTAITAWCAAAAPDVLMTSPAINFGSSQPDFFKAAQQRSIPTIAAIPSWDNLTTKGALAWMPDRMLVWNEAMRREALAFHAVPPERVTLTGATVFEPWFGWTPWRSREEFYRAVGLPDEAPYVLYLGSSAFLAPAEVEFAERWVAAIRSSEDPGIAGLSILIRPHPTNVRPWNSADLKQFGRLSVWPRVTAHPGEDRFRRDLFDSLYHCAAVVGMNTSAQIEAAILGKPVLSVRLAGFERSQTETLHFDHLASGLVLMADGFVDHIAQLRGVLDDPNDAATRSQRFVDEFVRPPAMYRSASEAFVAAVEEAAEAVPARVAVPAWAPLVRVAMAGPGWIITALFRVRDQPAWVLLLRGVFRAAMAVASVCVFVLDTLESLPQRGQSAVRAVPRWTHIIWRESRGGAVKVSKRIGRALNGTMADTARAWEHSRKRQRRRLHTIRYESAQMLRNRLHRERKRMARLRHVLRRALTGA